MPYAGPFSQPASPFPARLRRVPPGWMLSLFAALLAVASATTVFATPPTASVLVELQPESNQTTPAGPAPKVSFLSAVSRSDTMLGDMGGLRPFLSRFGISLTIQETSEVLGNVSGGGAPGIRV